MSGGVPGLRPFGCRGEQWGCCWECIGRHSCRATLLAPPLAFFLLLAFPDPSHPLFGPSSPSDPSVILLPTLLLEELQLETLSAPACPLTPPPPWAPLPRTYHVIAMQAITGHRFVHHSLTYACSKEAAEPKVEALINTTGPGPYNQKFYRQVCESIYLLVGATGQGASSGAGFETWGLICAGDVA